jgi:hypothetical protein
LIEQIASALDHAHSRGLVHRDVKPANVLLDGEGRAYLTDFGLSKYLAETGVTGTGESMGTPGYLPPEQIQGQRVDARGDIYSLGVCLYHALSGRAPFHRDNKMAVLWAHVHEPVPALPPAAVGNTPELTAVIRRAMAKVPEARFPSAGDLALAARAALEQRRVETPETTVAIGEAAPTTPLENGVTPRTTPVSVEPSAIETSRLQPQPRRRWLVAAALFLAIAGASVGGYLLWSPSDGEPNAPLRPEVATTVPPSGPPSEKPASKSSVPNVGGAPVRDAREQLEDRGFTIRVQREYSNEPVGSVIGQRPKAGAERDVGDVVRVRVSRGPEPLTKASRLSTSALGPIEFGMSLDEAQDVARTTIVENVDAQNGSCGYAEPDPAIPGLSFMLEGDRVVRADVTSPGINTVSGIHVGSTEAEVLATYGARIKSEQHEYDDQGHYLVYTPKDVADQTRIVFETDGSRVTIMRAGLLPAVLYIEGCL